MIYVAHSPKNIAQQFRLYEPTITFVEFWKRYLINPLNSTNLRRNFMNSNSHHLIKFLVTFRRNLKGQYFLLRNIICHFLLSKCCLRSLKLLVWGKNNHNWGRIVPPQGKHRDKRKTILVSVMPRPGQDAGNVRIIQLKTSILTKTNDALTEVSIM